MKKLIVTIWLLLSCAVVHAQTTYHVRAGATGAGDGSDWENALTVLPSSPVRGATYYLAAGNYPPYTMSSVAGTDLITIKKATIAEHGSSTGWIDSYEEQAHFHRSIWIQSSNVLLDGSYRKGNWMVRHGATYGIKVQSVPEELAARTLNLGSSTVGYIENVTVRYLEVQGRGDDGGGDPSPSISQDNVYLAYPHNNILFQKCYFHSAGRCLMLLRTIGSEAPVAGAILELSYLYHNEATGPDEPTGEEHSQGISAIGVSGWIVRNNIFETIEGTGFINASGSGWKVYGNVFHNLDPRQNDEYIWGANNGVFTGWSYTSLNDSLFFNNTVIGVYSARVGLTNSSGMSALNNLYFANQINAIAGQNAVSSHNSFGPTGAQTFGSDLQVIADNTIFADYAARDFRLTTNTDPGDDTIGAEYATDMLGNTRQPGAWSRGAFQYTGDIPTPATLRRYRIGNQRVSIGGVEAVIGE